MTNTPADWTDAEITRWMAERDGYAVVPIGETKAVHNGDRYGMFELQQDGKFIGPHTHLWESDAWAATPNYPRSLDAAVAWLGRRGLEWRRTFDVDEGLYAMEALDSIIWRACYESPTCPTSRALCNAGVAAEMAREAQG